MRSYRNRSLSNGQVLARRLDQLGATLDALGSRLRVAVSQAVGETAGVVIRDALNTTLDRIAGFRPDPEPPREARRGWGDEDEEDLWIDDDWEHEPVAYAAQAPPAKVPPPKLVLSFSAGLHVAAWWLRRWTGRLGVVSTAVAGVLASCGAYAAPALFAAGLRIIGSAGQLNLLTETVQSISSS